MLVADSLSYFLPPAAMVMDITVVILSSTSVRVSWDSLNISGITHYIVYYNQTEIVTPEKSVMVSGSENFVIINDLITGVEYQFQVTVIAERDGDRTMGERSEASILRLTPPSAPTSPSTINGTHF